MTVSPGANTGIVLPKRAISSFSNISMTFMCVLQLKFVAIGLACSAGRPLMHAFIGCRCVPAHAIGAILFLMLHRCPFAAILRQQRLLVARKRTFLQQVRSPFPCPA